MQPSRITTLDDIPDRCPSGAQSGCRPPGVTRRAAPVMRASSPRWPPLATASGRRSRLISPVRFPTPSFPTAATTDSERRSTRRSSRVSPRRTRGAVGETRPQEASEPPVTVSPEPTHARTGVRSRPSRCLDSRARARRNLDSVLPTRSARCPRGRARRPASPSGRRRSVPAPPVRER